MSPNRSFIDVVIELSCWTLFIGGRRAECWLPFGQLIRRDRWQFMIEFIISTIGDVETIGFAGAAFIGFVHGWISWLGKTIGEIKEVLGDSDCVEQNVLLVGEEILVREQLLGVLNYAWHSQNLVYLLIRLYNTTRWTKMWRNLQELLHGDRQVLRINGRYFWINSYDN